MEFAQFDTKYILRIAKGEELISVLKSFCQEKNISLGTINGIGATNKVTIGLFDPTTKQYYQDTLEDNFEISPLHGNITTMDGKAYLHLHINLCDRKHHSFGGHLNEAWISATAEVVIDTVDAKVDRTYSEEIGLNLLKFD